MKFDEITVTFHPNNPSKPVMIITEKKQLLIGTIIQISFLNTNHNVAIINNKTPNPKTTISLLINVIISSAIIGIPPKFIFPTKAIQLNNSSSKRLIPYSFYGPTCDGLDYMKGPFMLPANIKTGDYIEIGQLGAYGISFRTNFNGFYSNQIHEVKDKPLMSIYEADENHNVKTLFA